MARSLLPRSSSAGWPTTKIKTIYIEPGSPQQNGFVESFHGRFRDECLNREQLWTLTESQGRHRRLPQQIQPGRPHSKLGYQSPARLRGEGLYPSPWLRSRPAEPGLSLQPGMDNQRQLYQHQPIQTDSKGDSKRWIRSSSWANVAQGRRICRLGFQRQSCAAGRHRCHRHDDCQRGWGEISSGELETRQTRRRHRSVCGNLGF